MTSLYYTSEAIEAPTAIPVIVNNKTINVLDHVFHPVNIASKTLEDVTKLRIKKKKAGAAAKEAEVVKTAKVVIQTTVEIIYPSSHHLSLLNHLAKTSLKRYLDC